MSKREWKRYANGHGYCAVRVDDGTLLPWTYSSQRKQVKRHLADWLGADYDLNIAPRFRVIRCIVEAQ